MKSDKSDRFKEVLRTISNDAFRTLLNDGMYKALNANKEHFSNTRGVCCFSEIKDGLLMWAHYSSGYKGFCLEFCTDNGAMIAFAGAMRLKAMQTNDLENHHFSVKPRWNLAELQKP